MMGPMTEEEYLEQERKYRAKHAVDTILAAEQHKKDKELAKHIKAEMKERSKHLESAMGKSANKKAAVAKAKSAPKAVKKKK